VVGLSFKLTRASYSVAQYLSSQGYRIIPVNPGYKTIPGEKSYPSLKDIPEPVDTVNVFRAPEHVMPIVEDTIAIGAKAVWLQEGVVNEKAARKAQEAGLIVVMDRCIAREHRRLTSVLKERR
jgi:predicted CoA-binding protein